jgi:hypothetical protein
MINYNIRKIRENADDILPPSEKTLDKTEILDKYTEWLISHGHELMPNSVILKKYILEQKISKEEYETIINAIFANILDRERILDELIKGK